MCDDRSVTFQEEFNGILTEENTMGFHKGCHHRSVRCLFLARARSQNGVEEELNMRI